MLFAFLLAADLTFLDVPFNARGHFPSMQQSISISAASYEYAHERIERAFGTHETAAGFGVAIFDILTSFVLPMPPGDVWVHEEWHRAVMLRRNINSFDDVYRFRINPDSISVSHVRDDKLVQLKRDHPQDLVRLEEAGVEGEQALVLRLEKDGFFGASRAWNLPLYWFSKFGVSSYIASGSDSEVNEDTDRDNREDGANVRRRDFAGHDFTAWMYDLSRPDEPYQARGVHPSGVGIDRYRKPSQLTPDELRFLDRQGQLALISFLDPNLLGLERFTTRGVKWNVNALHQLTSFGYTIDANVFAQTAAHRIFVVAHRYTNRRRSFPGLEAELLDRPIGIRAGVWSQPKAFRDDHGRAGGFGAVRVHRGRLYGELEVKSAGWLAGNESLDANLAFRLGVSDVGGSHH